MTIPAPSGPVASAMFVGTWLPFSETFIYDQLQRQQKFRALVVAYERGPDADRFPYSPVLPLAALERLLYLTTGISPRIEGALRRHGARVIHAHFGPNGVQALPFARALGIPLAVTFHGHDVARLIGPRPASWYYRRYRRLAPRLFQEANLLLCASEELAAILKNELGAPPEKIVVHRLGIDLSAFPAVTRPERAPRVLMVGRFVEKKGFEYGLQAFARAARKHPALRLTLVGEGPRRPLYEKIVREEGLEGQVRLAGMLTPDAVRAEMAEADIFLMPAVVAADGDRESGTLVVKEACATGLPVVGSIHGGIPEIVEDGRTGYLVPERDMHGLAAALDRLAGAPELRAALGTKGREKMEREYDTVVQNRRLEELLASMLTVPPGS